VTMAIKLTGKNTVVRSLANKNKLTPFIDKALSEGEFEWEYKFDGKAKDDAWHPSGDCTPSLLDLYHKATGDLEERQFPVSLIKTFQVGHFWHQYLQWVVAEKLRFAQWEQIEVVGTKYWGDVEEFKKEDLFTQRVPDPEFLPNLPKDAPRAMIIKPKPYHWVRGSADICPIVIPGHGPYLVDFKTMGSHDFKRTEMPEWAAAKYECQANIYMDLFNMDQALIVCVQKDSPHDLKEFEYERNQPLIDAIYEKWHIVSDCLDQGVAPPEDEHIDLPLQGCSR
jgi:hypothetical protein